jgi:hypothetical protein
VANDLHFFGCMTIGCTDARFIAGLVTLLVLGVCPTAAAGSQEVALRPNAQIHPLHAPAGTKQAPARSTSSGVLTPEESSQLAAAMKRMPPKERKRLIAAVKRLTPEGRRQLTLDLKRQLAGKGIASQPIKRAW